MSVMDVNVALGQLIDLQRAAEHVVLLNRRSVQTRNTGGYLSRMRGRGMDFDETRIYQAGDDIRFMDWRVMARTGKAHTKLFCEERERPVFIVLDQSLSMRFGSRKTFKSVVAAQAATILAWAAVKQGDRVGGVVFHDSDFHAIRPKSRKQGVLPLIRQIVRINNGTPDAALMPSLERAMAQLRRICHPGGLIFIISDFAGMTPALEQHLRGIAEHSEVIACFVQDPLEREAPARGHYQVTDGKQHLSFNTHSATTCQQYQQQFAAHYDNVKSLLARQRIPLIDLSTPDEVATVLHQSLLKLRGRGSR